MIYKKDPQTISPYLKDASNFSGGSASKIIIPESFDELITLDLPILSSNSIKKT